VDIRVTAYTEYIERFELFLLPGLFLLGFELAVAGLVLRGLP